MKILKLVALNLLFLPSLFAQDINDALRNSEDNINGSARFRSMSGALGSVGGDISSININPAGSAFIQNNQASVTISSLNHQNKSNYFGSETKKNGNTFDLSQLSAIWILQNQSENSKWGNIALGINYENTKSNHNVIYSQGYNPKNSVDQYFISYANGLPLNSFADRNFVNLNYREQQAYMGYNGYLINEGLNNNYLPNSETTGNYYQENYLLTSGTNGKVSFNMAVEYDKRFYFGLNLNAHYSEYNKFSSFYEDRFDAYNNNDNTVVKALRFSNELLTIGSGFSFQIGGIAKITNELRAGISYESPTWYRFEEEITQNLTIDCIDCNGKNNIFDVTPNATMIFEPYKLQTPSRITGSLSYNWDEKAIISIDYSRKDYSNMRFKPKNEFEGTNNQISNLLQETNELRLGGEYKYRDLSFRAGYHFQESPYKDSSLLGNLNSYSTGIGYNFGEIKLDLAYTFSKRNYQQDFFSQGFTDKATINNKSNNVSVSVLFEL